MRQLPRQSRSGWNWNTRFSFFLCLAIFFSHILQHMRSLAGPSAHVHFTHLSKSSCQTLTALFAEGTENLAAATAHPEPVLTIMQDLSIPLDKVCLLDPKAEKEIAPEDGDGRFECFLFGVGTRFLLYPLFFTSVDFQGILGTWKGLQHYR